MSNIVTIPSMVGGLNTRDAYDTMDVKDCIQILNIYPRGTYCESREGVTDVIPFIGGKSLIEYHGTTPTILIGIGGSVYNDEVELKNGFTSNEWNGFYFKERSWLLNGVDTPQVFNGTTLTDWGFTGVSVGDEITNGFVSKNRCWFTYYNSSTGDTGAYYGAIGAISGALDKLSLNFKVGGKVVCGGNWSQDSGTGLDDMTYFIGENGEVIVYSGNNFPPDETDLFRIVEVFNIPKPLGYKCNVSVGGDVMIITQGGYVNLASYLSPNRANAVPVSNKINRLITDLKAYFTNYGWEIKYFKQMGAIWVSTPTKYTHVYNVVEPAWTVFDIKANSLAVINDTMYFINDTGYYKYGGYSGDNGTAIKCEVIQASTDLGYSNLKQFLGIKPIFEASNDVNFYIKLLVDLNPKSTYYTTQVNSTIGTAWDSAPWNSFAWYIGTMISAKPRLIKANTGRRVGLGLNFETKGKVKILSYDMLFSAGNQWK